MLTINKNDIVVISGSPIHGKGVYAKDDIQQGARIAYFKGYEIGHKTVHSVTFQGKYIEPTGKLKYLNHSCTPNSEFNGRWLVASQDIASMEEVTIDYMKTESEISKKFKCNCHSINCENKLVRHH